MGFQLLVLPQLVIAGFLNRQQYVSFREGKSSKTFSSNPNPAAKAMYGHSEIVQLLLSKGAQVNTNGDGETAIDLAYRYPETWIYLICCSFLLNVHVVSSACGQNFVKRWFVVDFLSPSKIRFWGILLKGDDYLVSYISC